MARPASIVVAVLLVAAAAPADALFWNHAAENVTAVCSSLREAPYKTSACTDFESQVCASVSSSCLSCATLAGPAGCEFATKPQVDSLTSCSRLNSQEGDGCSLTTDSQVRQAIQDSQVPIFAWSDVRLTPQGRCTEPQVSNQSPSFDERPILFECGNEGGNGQNARIALVATCPSGTIAVQKICGRTVNGRPQGPIFEGTYGPVAGCEWARPAQGEPRSFFLDVLCLPVAGGPLPGEKKAGAGLSRREFLFASAGERVEAKKP